MPPEERAATADRPEGELDDTIHSPLRLRICSLLDRLGSTEFSFLRETLEVSAPVLSKHLRRLEEAGYVRLDKGVVRSRTRTWASLTPSGVAAFRSHLAYLRDIIDASPSEPEQAERPARS